MGTGTAGSMAGRRRERVPVSLGRDRVTISAPARVAIELRSALRDLLDPADGVDGTVVRVRRSLRGYRVAAGSYRAVRSRGDTAVDQVVHTLLRVALDQQASWLHLHAGYVGRRGRGVLIAGADGSGKSTLVTELVRSGFDYFTDEMVGVGHRLELVSFPKPISLTAGSFERFVEVDPGRTGHGSGSAKVWHVPATVLRPGCLGAEVEPVAVVFVRYEPTARVAVRSLHPADAARRLLVDSPDAAIRGPEGMRRAVELCARLRCVELTHGDDDQAITAVRALVDEVRPPSVPVEPLSTVSAPAASSTVVDRDSVLARASSCSAVLVGDRALAWRSEGPQVVELDEPTTAWLALFDGKTPLGELADEVAAGSGLPPDEVAAAACSVAADLVEIGVVVAARGARESSGGGRGI